METQNIQRSTVNIAEAQSISGLGRDHIRGLLRNGKLSNVGTSMKRARILRVQLERFVNGKQNEMPHAGNAGRSSKPDQLLLHAALTAIQCAALLAMVISFALELLSVHPLEMLCGAMIVYAQRMVRDARLRNKRSRHSEQAPRSRLDADSDSL